MCVFAYYRPKNPAYRIFKNKIVTARVDKALAVVNKGGIYSATLGMTD
jgi:hypothetical protein